MLNTRSLKSNRILNLNYLLLLKSNCLSMIFCASFLGQYSISTLTLSIDTSFLFFELWLLRIFVFPGWIFLTHLLSALLEMTYNFSSCSRDVANKSTSSFAITQADAQTFFLQIIFQSLSVDEQTGQQVTLFRLPPDLEYFTLFVTHNCRFPIEVQSPHEIYAVLFHTACFKCFPN